MKQILSFLSLLVVISGKSQKTMIFQQATLSKPAMDNKSVIDWNKKQSGFGNLSQKEQEFYYWVNYSRENPKEFYKDAVLPMVKTYPQLKGSNLTSLGKELTDAQSIALLSLSPLLLKMSEAHAKDITSSNASPSHSSTNGEGFIDRFKKFGFKNCGGENISYGSGDTDPLFMLVMLYLDIGVSDLGHRKALLNPSFINTGIAIRNYSNGNTFLVEDFSCLQN